MHLIFFNPTTNSPNPFKFLTHLFHFVINIIYELYFSADCWWGSFILLENIWVLLIFLSWSGFIYKESPEFILCCFFFVRQVLVKHAVLTFSLILCAVRLPWIDAVAALMIISLVFTFCTSFAFSLLTGYCRRHAKFLKFASYASCTGCK